jgi:hypothetical protein
LRRRSFAGQDSNVLDCDRGSCRHRAGDIEVAAAECASRFGGRHAERAENRAGRRHDRNDQGRLQPKRLQQLRVCRIGILCEGLRKDAFYEQRRPVGEYLR